MIRKPDFFIVGAPKAGTTSLYSYLNQHPDIFMPELKEPHFFGGWRQISEEDLGEYVQLFSRIPESKVAGEASTSYLYLESAAAEIKAFQPDARIIILLRNPIDRAYSHYWNEVRSGFVNNSFEGELEAEKERARKGWRGFRPGVNPPAYYIQPGHYATHVERYIRIFGRELVSVHLLEDFTESPESVCRDVFKFLGVEARVRIDASQIYNVSGPPRNALLAKILVQPMSIKELMKRIFPISWLRTVKEWSLKKTIKAVPEMNPETRAYLQEVFKDDILYVQRLTGRDLSHWLGESL